MGFPSARISVHHVCNALSSCTDLRCFTICCLKRFFTLSDDAINDHNWSICFLPVMDNWWFCVFWSSSHTSASAALKPPNDFSFLRNHWCNTFPLVSSTSFSHIWISWSHWNSFMISIRSILSKIKSQDHYVHQKLQMSELLILGLFSLSARLIGARIKAVHCLSFTKFTKDLLPSISVIVFRHENVSLWHVIGTSPWKVGDRITAPECWTGGLHVRAIKFPLSTWSACL